MIQVHKDGAWMRVNPVGAEMVAYCDKSGRQRLWSGDPSVWGKVAPILFPVIGSVGEEPLRIGGKLCKLSKHGFVREGTFEILEAGEDFCTLQLRETPETLAQYPFPFTLTVKHRLVPQGFVTELRVENTGKEAMPFALGGHPGFACPLEEGEAFEDYVVRFARPEVGSTVLCLPGGFMGGTELVDLGPDRRTVSLSYADYDRKDTLIFTGLSSRSADLVHKTTGRGIRFSFPHSPILALWTMPHKHAPYLCLEPWNGLAAFANESGNFEDKPYHEVVAPGETFCLEYGMEILG